MNKMNLIVTSIMGLVLSSGLNAQGPKIDSDQFDINSITYIEEEPDIDLGFNPMDYLPENFEAYANPSDFRSINYIDPNDEFAFDLDICEFLPEGFDPYVRVTGMELETL